MRTILAAVAVAAVFGACIGAHSGSSSYHTRGQYRFQSHSQGQWSYWSDYSECTVTCGGGEQTRSRTCQRPHSYYGPSQGYNPECYGDDSETRDCNTYPCPIDGAWSEWGEYSDCSTQCGYGEKTRERTCTSPAPANGGRDCYGQSEQSTHCHEYKCPVDGGWSYWGYFSYCSKPCGGGEKTRERGCTYPEPRNGGADCEGEAEETMACNEYPCRVNGAWTEWGDYSDCSTQCGYGEKTRERTCTAPAPANGGYECYGPSEESVYCHEYKCPVDGGWAYWGKFGECSVECGGGEKIRERTCTHPEPSNGGAECEGEGTDSMSCNEDPCPVDGMWSEWGDYEECPVTCGGGVTMRSRECNNPEPKYGGADCEGEAGESMACNEDHCPVAGGWGYWAEWSKCSGYCGEGERTRSRVCDMPEPAYGGVDCEGDDSESEKCKHYAPCYTTRGYGSGSNH